jgi:mRNA interferase MazF
MVNRGDVCWAELSDDGHRPVLVLTRSAAIPSLNKIIVIPLTTTIRGIPTEVPLGPEDGLPKECVASFDNLRLVRHAQLGERITSLSGPKMHEVCGALAIATGCR